MGGGPGAGTAGSVEGEREVGAGAVAEEGAVGSAGEAVAVKVEVEGPALSSRGGAKERAEEVEGAEAATPGGGGGRGRAKPAGEVESPSAVAPAAVAVTVAVSGSGSGTAFCVRLPRRTVCGWNGTGGLATMASRGRYPLPAFECSLVPSLSGYGCPGSVSDGGSGGGRADGSIGST